MMKRTLLAALMALTVIVPAGAETIVSDFEAGADGWQIKDMNCTGTVNTVYGTYAVNTIVSGGCDGGFIEGPDPSSNCFYFDAPAQFLGDQSAYLGGRLTFCIRSTMSNWPDSNLVVLAGAGLVVVAEIKPFPTVDWQQITIPLGSCYFRKGNKGGAAVSTAELAAVLADLNSLRISGEYGSIVAETTGLDSVMLIEPPIADIDPECGVGIGDMMMLAEHWVLSPAERTVDLFPDCRIDLQDFAVIAELWLSEDGCSPE